MRQKIINNFLEGGRSFYYRDIFSGLTNEKMGPALYRIAPPNHPATPFSAMHHSSESEPSKDPSPEEKFILKENSNELAAFISTLPAKCRDLYYLYFYKDFTRIQIATHLHISKSTVQIRLTLSIYLLKIFVLKHKPGE